METYVISERTREFSSGYEGISAAVLLGVIVGRIERWQIVCMGARCPAVRLCLVLQGKDLRLAWAMTHVVVSVEWRT